MSLDHDAAVKDLDAVLAALVDIKPMADYGVVGSYDTVQARRQQALAKAEQSLLALRAKLIDASGVRDATDPPAVWRTRMVWADSTKGAPSQWVYVENADHAKSALEYNDNPKSDPAIKREAQALYAGPIVRHADGVPPVDGGQHG